MSGFGIRAFKKVQDDEKKDKQQYVKHIVYGENSFAVTTFIKLFEKYPGEVKLITKNPYFKDDLIKDWKCTLNPIRSESVAQRLMSINPSFEIFKTSGDVVFYKDTKFHKFGGRAKPHQLIDGEEFFTCAPYNFKNESVFTKEQFDSLDNVLKENQVNKIVKEIEITRPDDLVEKTNFKLLTGEFDSYNCEYLYFCESPKTFYSLVNDKNSIPDNLQEFIAPITNHQGICVNYNCSGKIYDGEGTVILPQSLTHEWGSFILDFERYNESDNTQEFTALTFINEEGLQEDDLAKKIKLMNRVIERVMPNFGEVNVEQSIKYNSEYRISGINDEKFDSIKNEAIKFLGQASPLNMDSSDDFQYSARANNAIMSMDL